MTSIYRRDFLKAAAPRLAAAQNGNAVGPSAHRSRRAYTPNPRLPDTAQRYSRDDHGRLLEVEDRDHAMTIPFEVQSSRARA